MKLADLIGANYQLLNVLSRMGIGLGFGELTINEVCESQGIDKDSFLLICDVYTYDDFVPSKEILATADPSTLVDYLHNSHAFYLYKAFSCHIASVNLQDKNQLGLPNALFFPDSSYVFTNPYILFDSLLHRHAPFGLNLVQMALFYAEAAL